MLPRSVFAIAIILTPAASMAGDAIELEFVDHIKAEMIEQDVYVDKMSDGKLYRVTTEDASDFSEFQVFRTAAPVEHAPMDASKIGPYDAGAPLNFTLGEWLSASGTATLECNDGSGVLRAEFQNLVPNGVYTMWNFFAGQQLAKFHTYDLPVGAPDGSQSAFTADGKGSAIFEASFEPCLDRTSPQLMAGLAIAYHSDGETHGYEPGPMGNKSHVQLFAVIPPAMGTN